MDLQRVITSNRTCSFRRTFLPPYTHTHTHTHTHAEGPCAILHPCKSVSDNVTRTCIEFSDQNDSLTIAYTHSMKLFTLPTQDLQ